MTRAEFLQGLRTELEGRVPYSGSQEHIRDYDSYISDEISKGADEAEVIENLGGPRIIARTIVDAALNTEDRPDGYETYGSGETQEADDNSQSREYSGPYGTVDREESYQDTHHRNVHYVDFSKWYVRLAAGLIVFFIIFLLMSLFFGIIGLAGWVLSYIWPVLLILMIFWMFKGPGI